MIAGLLVRSPCLSGRSCDRSSRHFSWFSTHKLRRRTSTEGRRDPTRRVRTAGIGHARCFMLWFEQVAINLQITRIDVCTCEWVVTESNLAHNFGHYIWLYINWFILLAAPTHYISAVTDERLNTSTLTTATQIVYHPSNWKTNTMTFYRRL